MQVGSIVRNTCTLRERTSVSVVRQRLAFVLAHLISGTSRPRPPALIPLLKRSSTTSLDARRRPRRQVQAGSTAHSSRATAKRWTARPPTLHPRLPRALTIARPHLVARHTCACMHAGGRESESEGGGRQLGQRRPSNSFGLIAPAPVLLCWWCGVSRHTVCALCTCQHPRIRKA